ncbi:hypothetical protein AAOGI_41280 [Agarivorans albus]
MKKSIFVLFWLLLSFGAMADYRCEVTIKRVLVYGDGSVNILHDGRNDYTYICDLNKPRKGVEIVTCAMWVSMLQSLQHNNTKAVFYYSGNGSCPTLPTYSSSPAPVYIGSIAQ